MPSPQYYTAKKLFDINANVEFDKMGLEDPTTELLQGLFPLTSPCLCDNVIRMIVVYGPQDTSPVDAGKKGEYAGCYVLHLSEAASSDNEGGELGKDDARARAFKSSTARLLYPVQISVNVEAAKKFDRVSFFALHDERNFVIFPVCTVRRYEVLG